MSWTERILGIALGVILGIAVVVVFVFVYSEQTVDAPSISDQAPNAHRGDAKGGGRDRRLIPQEPGLTGRPTPVANVRIIGGAPPPSGPVQLHYRNGEEINLRVVSDETVRLQVLRLGSGITAYAGEPVGWQFKASKTGDFPLVVVPSHIDVATITVR